jgi:hypothetical protein
MLQDKKWIQYSALSPHPFILVILQLINTFVNAMETDNHNCLYIVMDANLILPAHDNDMALNHEKLIRHICASPRDSSDFEQRKSRGQNERMMEEVCSLVDGQLQYTGFRRISN